jgi:type II secretory pathway pseudopilin PulG
MRIINSSGSEYASDNSEGFTLVEMLVTILVSVVLIGSLSVITNNNVFLSQRGRDLTVVNSFAENKVEELRSKGFLALSNGATDIATQMPSELKAPRSGLITISDASTGLKLVTVTLTYNAQGKTQTQTYKTYIGELGVGQY